MVLENIGMMAIVAAVIASVFFVVTTLVRLRELERDVERLQRGIRL